MEFIARLPPFAKAALSHEAERWQRWISHGLNAIGLVFLADLTTVAHHTAMSGTSTYMDLLILAPGLHRQPAATRLNESEYPACAAMTSGYVFRVENPATVLYLQNVGRAGHLTTLSVSSPDQKPNWLQSLGKKLYDVHGAPPFASAVYFLSITVTIVHMRFLVVLQDNWALIVVELLMFARALNTFVIRRRAPPDWHGASEPGIKGDILVLLSQDRWVRVQGLVDDLKAVLSGQWLREPTFLESSLMGFGTLLVYIDAALAFNATHEGKLLLLTLMLVSSALLGIVNELTKVFRMHGRTVRVRIPPVKYNRRLDMAKELVEEMGRKDWAIRLGIVQPDQESLSDETVTM